MRLVKDGTVRAVRERVWVLHDQDLMSVNGPDGPAVYLIDLHTRHGLMRANKANKEIKGLDAKKRELTKFETAALPKLRGGEDVVLQSSDKEMHVLGAVRASKACLECHRVDVGALLGAFTYTLTLQSQETPNADRLKDHTGLSREQVSAVLTIESNGGKMTREKDGPVWEVALSYLAATSYARSSEESYRYISVRDASLKVLSVFPEMKVLDVSHSNVTDDGLGTIAKLKWLEKLDLRYTLVTADGLTRLKKELPNCQIRHQSTEPDRSRFAPPPDKQ
jgi:hypothetical protein